MDGALDPSLAALQLPLPFYDDQETEWNPTESLRLDHLVSKYGAHNWAAVASEIEGRSPEDCRLQWLRVNTAASAQGREGDIDVEAAAVAVLGSGGAFASGFGAGSGLGGAGGKNKGKQRAVEDLQVGDIPVGDINIHSTDAHDNVGWDTTGHHHDTASFLNDTIQQHFPTPAQVASTSHHIPSLSAQPSAEVSGSPKPKEAIPKKNWSEEEDKRLLRLVDENGPREWAKLARILGTGRTGPSCCARWCRLAGPKAGGTNVSDDPKQPTLSSNAVAYQAISKGPRTKWNKWTPAEDAELVALVEEHGPKNWHFISSHMSTARGGDSCCGRWMHYLQPKTQRVVEDGVEIERPTPKSNKNAAHPRWNAAEDAQLTILKLQNRDESWAFIAGAMKPPRTIGSCRARWTQKVLFKNPDMLEPGKAEGYIEQAKKTIENYKTGYGDDGEEDMNVGEGEPVDGDVDGEDGSSGVEGIPVESSEGHGLRGVVVDPLLVDLGGGSGSKARKGKSREKDLPVHNRPAAPVHRPTSWIDSQGNRRDKASEPVQLEPVGPVVLTPREENGEEGEPEAEVYSTPGKSAIRPWTETEEAHLIQLVGMHGRKGWVKIAKEMGTGRSAAAVSARWQRLTSKENKEPEKRKDGGASSKAGSWKAWTPEDDAELKAQVTIHGKNNWKLVGQSLSSPRSEYAASSRWYDHIVKNASVLEADRVLLASKRRWTPEEDAELAALVQKHGAQRWTEIGKAMSSGRPGTACRLRWLNYIQHNLGKVLTASTSTLSGLPADLHVDPTLGEVTMEQVVEAATLHALGNQQPEEASTSGEKRMLDFDVDVDSVDHESHKRQRLFHPE
ncbi:hypothetical protein MNV49_001905 [Pseudohyphozyma bogoriensis]|nr:hypothetical protein MNV49_001905 [Pseudohyphozyma bogoriensis]